MDLPPPRAIVVGRSHSLATRLRTWWPAKMLGTTLGMAAFFVAYFWVLRHPLFPVTTMPFTVVDQLIGFRPEALVLYLSLWLYVSLVPALLVERRELLSYGLATVALSVLGLGIFLLWPTTVARPDIDWSQHPAFVFLASVDASGNACPSLHVAFAVFTAAWLGRVFRSMSAGPLVRTLNWAWCVGILYSTIATRQHVALDVVAGAVLGAIVAVINLRWLRVPRSAD